MLHQLPASAHASFGREAERGFDLWEILNFCWREWKFMTAVFMTVLVIGTVYTWRQIPDWLDAKHLPDWVVNGKGASR